MRKLSFFVLFALFVLDSCIDTIEVDLPSDISGRLVIEGVAERSVEEYRFLAGVTRTISVDDEGRATKQEANISLIYNDEEILSLRNGDAFTIPVEDFHTRYGGTPQDAWFNIRVATPEGGVFQSESQRIMSSPLGAQVSLELETRPILNEVGNVLDVDYIKIFANAFLQNNQGERVSFLWDVSGVFLFPEGDVKFVPSTCYVEDVLSINSVNLLNSAEVSGNEVRAFKIGETEADFRFARGYYFTLIQKAINHNAASYWEEVKQSITRLGTIYDPPTGQISSNIVQVDGVKQDVLGYFYTAGIDTIRYLATAEETGRQRSFCNNPAVSEVCGDCLLWLNSTYKKPAYWIE